MIAMYGAPSTLYRSISPAASSSCRSLPAWILFFWRPWEALRILPAELVAAITAAAP
jgi:hypothetical protein